MKYPKNILQDIRENNNNGGRGRADAAFSAGGCSCLARLHISDQSLGRRFPWKKGDATA